MAYRKLVRDNIPDIIKKNGEEPIIMELSDNDYKLELEKKLFEECNEVVNSNEIDRIEELADVLEILIALGKIEGKTFEEIISVFMKKRIERGGFDRKIFLADVKRKNIKNRNKD